MILNSSFEKNYNKEIEKIKNDYIHGSTYLTLKVISLILKYIKQYNFKLNSQKIIQNDFQEKLKIIANIHPQMASIFNFVNNLLHFIDTMNHDQYYNYIPRYCEAFKKEFVSQDKSIAKSIELLISNKQKIMTYSSSSTILNVLISLKENQHDFSVYCSESRPNNEGINLARNLHKKNIKTNFFTDAGLFSKCSVTDIVIIGADGINKKGIINKIGSYPLIFHAHNHNIPCYALCSSYKLFPYAYQPIKEDIKPTKEIIKQSPSNVNVVNYYFDTTPLRLFNGIITEKGLQDSEQLLNDMRKKDLHKTFQNRKSH